ncbi:unnamed protein product [Notodromas monacha]|uniref:Major facilitator superfamily (MFS) profile domain-containing protein n=1 Tax=Notodromas monacha TaxID=399045 RepID=A0A7R9BTY4_9CRUS|nr:unnamed protein product [Notodromas monacha]CAG0920085.1 unnamed protein product [Notodromas monacha]
MVWTSFHLVRVSLMTAGKKVAATLAAVTAAAVMAAVDENGGIALDDLEATLLRENAKLKKREKKKSFPPPIVACLSACERSLATPFETSSSFWSGDGTNARTGCAGQPVLPTRLSCLGANGGRSIPLRTREQICGPQAVTSRKLKWRKSVHDLKYCPDVRIPTRWVIAGVTFVGFIFNLGLRTSINIALVAMVNFTAVPQKHDHHDNDSHSGNSSVLEKCYIPEKTINNVSIGDTLSISGNVTSRLSGPSSSGEGSFVWDETAQGAILGSFYWGYVFTQLLGGRLSERFGPKRVLMGSLVSATVVTLLIPSVAHLGVGWVIAFRILQGICEGPTFPTMNVIISRWAVANERSMMVSVIYTGGPAGTMLTLYIGGLIIPLLGYQAIFYLTGVGCLFWALAHWFLVYDSPAEHPRITEKELAMYPKSAICNKTAVKTVPWRKILTSTGVWSVIVCTFSKGWAMSISFMIPIYLKAVLGFDLKSRLTFADVFGNAICFFLLSFAGCDYVAAIVALTVGSMLGGAAYSGYNACVMEMSPTYTGTVGGLSAMGFSVGSFLSPMVAGMLLQGRCSLGNRHYPRATKARDTKAPRDNSPKSEAALAGWLASASWRPLRSRTRERAKKRMQNLTQWAIVYQQAGAIFIVGGIFFIIFGTAERLTFDPQPEPEQDPKKSVTQATLVIDAREEEKTQANQTAGHVNEAFSNYREEEVGRNKSSHLGDINLHNPNAHITSSGLETSEDAVFNGKSGYMRSSPSKIYMRSSPSKIQDKNVLHQPGRNHKRSQTSKEGELQGKQV